MTIWHVVFAGWTLFGIAVLPFGDRLVRWLERRGHVVKRDEPRREFVDLRNAFAELGGAIRDAIWRKRS